MVMEDEMPAERRDVHMVIKDKMPADRSDDKFSLVQSSQPCVAWMLDSQECSSPQLRYPS